MSDFWAKVEQSPDDDGCWLWTGYRNWAGYGVVAVAHRRKRVAHRVAYELMVGQIPEGLELDHLCRNRACVNPDHLEAVRHVVNVLRGEAPNAVSVRTGACLHGHPWTEASTWIDKRGDRHCRPCRADEQRRRRARCAAAYREAQP